MHDLRIIFMGTPQFAVESLKILIDNGYAISGVITAPDKPAGRGQQIKQSEVKQFALENKLNILQPDNLKDEKFVQQVKEINPDLMIVVAFRMLPESIWSIPRLGTFNLHSSLLPQYRGAAPINHAIINGEKETGVTTFFIQHEIDTGSVILQEKVLIDETDNAGTLHDKLMFKGAELVLKTIRKIENNDIKTISQENLMQNQKQLKPAPKIFKDDCKINWNESIITIYNKIRGLSPYPTSWTELILNDTQITAKIYSCTKDYSIHNYSKPTLLTDNKTYLKVFVNGGFININEIQIAGKKRMSIADYLRGTQNASKLKLAQ